VEKINHFFWNFLLPQYKFLKDEWKEFLPDKKTSLYLLCMRHLMIPEGADERNIWERVIDEEIPEHEMQPQQRHQINIYEYDDMFMIL